MGPPPFAKEFRPINNWYPIKAENFLTVKEIRNYLWKKATEWEKLYAAIYLADDYYPQYTKDSTESRKQMTQ